MAGGHADCSYYEDTNLALLGAMTIGGRIVVNDAQCIVVALPVTRPVLSVCPYQMAHE